MAERVGGVSSKDITPKPAEFTLNNEEGLIAEVFKKDCVEAGYNIFQLVDVQMSRTEPGGFRPLRPPIFWGGADSFRPINSFIERATGKTGKVDAVKKEWGS